MMYASKGALNTKTNLRDVAVAERVSLVEQQQHTHLHRQKGGPGQGYLGDGQVEFRRKRQG